MNGCSLLTLQIVIYVRDEAPDTPELIADAAQRFNITLPAGKAGVWVY
jgi:hypothetical protein